ncbi:MAG TPA: hypothetical protein VKD67_08390 [Acidimicrobiales bacterium]|nr:hypothetical protein [Acidimicrobiales bacterium]
MTVHLTAGAATGIGSLPHTDERAAAEFVLERLPDLPAIPSLPRRSPAESMLGQVAAGVPGVAVTHDGRLVVDRPRLDPEAEIVTDLDHDAFGGFRAFLSVAAAAGGRQPVKWQFTGPVTLGVALVHAGVPARLAFTLARRAVQTHLRALNHAVASALPNCPQVVVLDEPAMSGLMQPGFPIDPDGAIDLVSGALAAIDTDADALGGVHCCGQSDWPAILATGPQILSLPVRAELASVGGYLAEFLDGGGWIAWGVVPTDGPVAPTVDRYWRDLAEMWCSLVQAGCDPGRLRRQAIVTPACGLGLHDEAAAAHVFELVDGVAERVHGQAVATRLSIGA